MPRKVSRRGVYKSYKNQESYSKPETFNVFNTIFNFFYDKICLIKNIFFNGFT